jgi:MFS family permease
MRNRNMALLLAGQLISQVGDKFHLLAVAFLVLKTTGSPARMGIVLFCSLFPAMLLGIFAGAVLDRYNIKRIIVAADLIRGLIVAALAMAYTMDVLSFGHLLLAQTLISSCTAFFDPAIPAVLPQLVEREALPQANAQTQLISGIATIIGPILGGLTIAWGGYLPVFLINAGSYLFSGAFESLMRLPFEKRKAAENARIGRDILEGWRYLARRQELGVLLAMVGVIHLFVGGIEAVIPVLASGLRGDGAANMGFLQTALGVGIVMAALVISFRRIAAGESRFLFGSVFCIGLLLLVTGSLTAWGVNIVSVHLPFFFGIGCAIICAGTSFRCILQDAVAQAMLGRVFGLASSLGNISIPVAALAAGGLMEYVTPAYLMMVSGAFLLPLSLGARRLYLIPAACPL